MRSIVCATSYSLKLFTEWFSNVRPEEVKKKTEKLAKSSFLKRIKKFGILQKRILKKKIFFKGGGASKEVKLKAW